MRDFPRAFLGPLASGRASGLKTSTWSVESFPIWQLKIRVSPGPTAWCSATPASAVATGNSAVRAVSGARRAAANAAATAAARSVTRADRSPPSPAIVSHMAPTWMPSAPCGGGASTRSAAADTRASRASQAPWRLPSGAATNGWCARSTRGPARPSGTPGDAPRDKPRPEEADSEALPGAAPVPAPLTPQKTPSAAPARRRGNSPQRAAGAPDASPSPSPGDSAGQPLGPDSSAACSQCRNACSISSAVAPASTAASIATRAARRTAGVGCSSSSVATRCAALVAFCFFTCAPCDPSSSPTHRANTSASSAPSLAIADGAKYVASGRSASSHTFSFVASFAAASSAVAAAAIKYSAIAPSVRCEGFTAPVLARGARSLTSAPPPPAAKPGLRAKAPASMRSNERWCPSLVSFIPAIAMSTVSLGRAAGRSASHTPSASVTFSRASFCTSTLHAAVRHAHASAARLPIALSDTLAHDSWATASNSPARAVHSFGRRLGSSSSALTASKRSRAASTFVEDRATAAMAPAASARRHSSTCFTCASSGSQTSAAYRLMSSGADSSSSRVDRSALSGLRLSCFTAAGATCSANSSCVKVLTSGENMHPTAEGSFTLGSPPNTTRRYASIAAARAAASASARSLWWGAPDRDWFFAARPARRAEGGGRVDGSAATAWWSSSAARPQAARGATVTSDLLPTPRCAR
mmetsp:Transcript_31735/g.79696  ORF Transcript_31735/g.79696 Transcript_31735/m.79696 type:complete len:700 (-) Transcript_31735:491-2590(-)